MLLETAPLIVLYELSIVLARRLRGLVGSPSPGAPAAIVRGGRSRLTTELAPITQRSPTVTPLVTAQLTPNQQLAPISTGPFEVKPCR